MKNTLLILSFLLFGIINAQNFTRNIDSLKNSLETYEITIKFQDSSFYTSYKNNITPENISFDYYWKKDSVIIRTSFRGCYLDYRRMKTDKKYYIKHSKKILKTQNTISSKKDTTFTIKIYYDFKTRQKNSIFFYPKRKRKILIKLPEDEKITYSLPKYNNIWKIKVEPNGSIIRKKGEKYFKYPVWYNSVIYDIDILKFKTGFVVEGYKTENFLKQKLKKIGLTDSEIWFFITYSLSDIKNNEYSFIHFFINEECNNIAQAEINPKPDSKKQVYILYFPVGENFKTKPQELEHFTTNNKEFTVIKLGAIGTRATLKINQE